MTESIQPSVSASASSSVGACQRCADCPARDTCLRLHHQHHNNTNSNIIMGDSSGIARITAADDDIEDSAVPLTPSSRYPHGHRYSISTSSTISSTSTTLLLPPPPNDIASVPPQPQQLVRRRSAPRYNNDSSTNSTPTNGSPLYTSRDSATAIIPSQLALPAIVIPAPSLSSSPYNATVISPHNNNGGKTSSPLPSPLPAPLPLSLQLSSGAGSGANTIPSSSAPSPSSRVPAAAEDMPKLIQRPKRPLSPRELQTISWTWEEIRQHTRAGDCWLVAHNIVYDASSFVDIHPAGSRTILRKAGQDVTHDFDFHSPPAQKKWRPLAIGHVAGTKPSLSCFKSQCVIM